MCACVEPSDSQLYNHVGSCNPVGVGVDHQCVYKGNPTF